MRALIAGFGPFPGAPSNPSAALAKALGRRRRPALAGLERHVHIFATSYAAVGRDLPALLAQKPDIVLMFGFAGRRRKLCVETRARNAVSVLFPDAGRNRPQSGAITAGEPSCRHGNAPFPYLLRAAADAACPSRLSDDAGRYLCNYAYWQALRHCRGATPLIAFIHIPAVRSRKRRGRRRAPALPQFTRAAEALLIALAAATRR